MYTHIYVYTHIHTYTTYLNIDEPIAREGGSENCDAEKARRLWRESVDTRYTICTTCAFIGLS